MIQIMLVIDDPMLGRLLEEYFNYMRSEYVVQRTDSASIIEAVPAGNQIDMILLDIGGETGTANIKKAERIKSSFSHIKSLIITDLPDPSLIERARKTGIDSFWYKNSNLEDLVSIIEKTIGGERVFPTEAKVVSLGNAFSNDITMREIEVLREVADGETDAAIAQKLHISLRTVNGHIQSMREKTGFRNRTELAVRARECGLVINTSDQ